MMRQRIGAIAIIAAALLGGTGCAAVNHQAGQQGLTYTAQARPALVPQLITAQAAAEVAVTPGQDGGQQCLRFQQTTRGGTTSLQTGGWNCAYGGYYGTGYGSAQGYRPGEDAALAARGATPGLQSPYPPATDPTTLATDPALAARVESLEASVQTVVNQQAEALAAQPAR